MDNGRTNAIFSKTEGDKTESLNQDDWQRSLEISAPANLPTPEELQEKAGEFFNAENTVGNFPTDPANEILENQANSDNEPPLNQPIVNSQELGQITPIATPTSVVPATTNRSSYNPNNIKTTGDKLEKSTIPEIDNAINKLNQTGDLNSFYDEIRGEGGMTDANLNNSFNRKLGSDQGKAA